MFIIGLLVEHRSGIFLTDPNISPRPVYMPMVHYEWFTSLGDRLEHLCMEQLEVHSAPIF